MNRISTLFVFLDRWHWLFLLGAVPFLFFPSPTNSLALLIVPLLWIIAAFAHREPLTRTPLNLTLLVIFVMVLVSEWATFDLAWSLPKIAGMILGIGIYFAFTRYGTVTSGWWLGLFVLLIISVGIAVFALVGTQWSAKFPLLAPVTSQLALRISGIPGIEEGTNPNYVAGELAWVLPLWLMLTRAVFLGQRYSKKSPWLNPQVVLLLVMVMASAGLGGVLILTQSRGGYLAIALTIALIALIVIPANGRRVLIGIALAVSLVGLILWNRGVISPSSFLDSNPTATDSALNTVDGRLEVWSRALYGIQDFPFTGMGMNTFRRIVPVLYPLFLISPDTDIGHAHNEFLQAALDLGIPGLIAFMALYWGAFAMLWRTWGRTRLAMELGPQYALGRGFGQHILARLRISPLASPRFAQAIVLGLGGGLFAHLIWGMTDAMALGGRPGFLFWMLLGLIAGLDHQSEAGLAMMGQDD